MFWKRRAGSSAPPAEESSAPELSPIRVYTADSIVDGWIEPVTERLSDVLNVVDSLSVARAREPEEADWVSLQREEMLLIAPPPQGDDSARRLHRVRRPIHVVRGRYIVEARVHLIAGIDLDPHLARSGRQFLALTDAWVRSHVQRDLDERHPELLVNVRSTVGELELNVME
jgi:hypothetical protein